MTEARKGEIALLMIKSLAKDRGVPTSDLQRRAGNEAEKFGITKEEYIDFVEIITREIVDEAFKNARRPRTIVVKV